VSISFSNTFDASDPGVLANFWAIALGYILQPPPEGFASWDEWADSVNMPEDQRGQYAAIIEPDGDGRILFLRVPEKGVAKNRLHMDVHLTSGLPESERQAVLEAHLQKLVSAGGTEMHRRSEFGTSWVVMHDPEGNVFCVI
jgi:hypothetical protein